MSGPQQPDIPPPRMGHRPPEDGGELPLWSSLTPMQWQNFLSTRDRPMLPEHTMWGSVLWDRTATPAGFIAARPDLDIQVAHRAANEITQRRLTKPPDGWHIPRSERGWIGAVSGMVGATVLCAIAGEPAMVAPAIGAVSPTLYVAASRWNRLTASNQWIGFQWGSAGAVVGEHLHQIGRILAECHVETPVYRVVRSVLWESYPPQSLAVGLSETERQLRLVAVAAATRAATVDQGMQHLREDRDKGVNGFAVPCGLDVLAEYLRTEAVAHREVADEYRRREP